MSNREEIRVFRDETRVFRSEQMRVSDDGQTITGLAVPYDKLSDDLGGFQERFKPGAFTQSLAAGGDVRADIEHDSRIKLGRSSKGTVSLKEDRKGVSVSIAVPATTVGRDAVEDVRNGNLDGMSIGFIAEDERFVTEGRKTIRELIRATLTAVTLTQFPAYPQTAGTVALRSLQAYQQGQNEVLRKRLDLAGLDDPGAEE